MNIKNRLYVAVLTAGVSGGVALYFTDNLYIGLAAAVAGFALGGLINNFFKRGK